MNRPVLFIHDAWLTPATWDPFKSRFAACGYTCSVPPWPAPRPPAEGAPSATRPAGPGIAQLIDHYASIAEGLPAAPLLVGHGFGGLIVQMLLDRGLGSAGIALAPLPPRGVRPGILAFDLLPLLLEGGPCKQQVAMSFEHFAARVAQCLSPEEQCAAYRRYSVAIPRRILYQAVLGIASGVDFANDRRAPLLLIAGENDRAIRASLVVSIYHQHHRSVAPTSYKCFAGRSHWLIAEPGWEEVADYSIEWSQAQSGRF